MIPITPASEARMASHIFYFRENFERKETILVSVASGSSPGIKEATAITADRRATKAPNQAKMSCD
jgi:hypothetical protein